MGSAGDDDLARALEEKTRRLAAERLELAERMERELADLRADGDARLAAERARADRLEVQLVEARAALADVRRKRTPGLVARLRLVSKRLGRRR